MKIISHRGYWKSPDEKNSEIAFKRSFDASFGLETDVRDQKGSLVISHDVPVGQPMNLMNLMELIGSYPDYEKLTLALNIKSDGLADMVGKLLSSFEGLDCFVFDMAIPDMRLYLQSGVPVFTRMSEVERDPVWLDRSAGIWLDSFELEWYTTDLVKDLLSHGKRVCVVSQELHGRQYEKQWKKLRNIDDMNLMICTDYPDKAASYFMKDEML